MSGWEVRQYMSIVSNVHIYKFHDLSWFILIPGIIMDYFHLKGGNGLLFEAHMSLKGYAVVLNKIFNIRFDVADTLTKLPIGYRGIDE